MNILGISGHPHPVRPVAGHFATEIESGFYHNSAVVALGGGELLCAVEEERLSRKKDSGKLPVRAILATLAHCGWTVEDVDLIAWGEEGGAGRWRDETLTDERVRRTLEHELGAAWAEIPVRRVDHHTAHAYSTFVASGFDEALVLTYDGDGDDASLTVWDAGADGMRELRRLAPSHSLGHWYCNPLPFLSYARGDEYKVMGLSAYGDPSELDARFVRSYSLEPEGHYRLHDPVEPEELARTYPPRRPGEPFLEVHRSLSAAIQKHFEILARHVLSHFAEETGHRQLCLAGGCAQNSLFNGRILADRLFDALFVQPASTDSGNALGAAYHAWLDGGDRPKPEPMTHAYLGPHVETGARLDAILRESESLVTHERVDPVEKAAELLASGEVIGWVQGRLEFGPRALGNRSILADPRSAEMKDRINGMVKERESFRPFAPAVVEEQADRYFDLRGARHAAPFMTVTVGVHEAARAGLEATTHVDGTARAQTVSRATNPRFHALIEAFGALTGTPIVLNTSFNRNGEPMVASARDAIQCMLSSGMRHLVVHDRWIRPVEDPVAGLAEVRLCLRSDVALVEGWAFRGGARERFHALRGPGRREVRDLPEYLYEVLRALRPDATVGDVLEELGVDAHHPDRRHLLEALWQTLEQRLVLLEAVS